MINGIRRRVLAVDDIPIFLTGLKSLLFHVFPELIVDTATSYEEALEQLDQQHYDLALLDLDLRNSEHDGFHLAEFIRKHYPKTYNIILTVNVKVDYIERLREAGTINGFLDKNIGPELLNEAVSVVLAGGFFLQPELKESLEHGRWFNLTPRERQITDVLSKGLTKKEVAAHLFISVNTVDKHLRNIFDKVGVNSTPLLVSKYIAYKCSNTSNESEIPPFKK